MIVTNNIGAGIQSNKKELIQQPNYRKKYDFSAYGLSVPSPIFSILEKSKYYLLETADRKPLDTKYHRRPDLFCQDTYGDPGFYFMILFVNDMFSLMDFLTDSILIPTTDRVLTVLRETEARKAFGEIKQTIQI